MGIAKLSFWDHKGWRSAYPFVDETSHNSKDE